MVWASRFGVVKASGSNPDRGIDMCRLLAITASDISSNAKVDILDRSMLLLRTEFQKDGWGISDGINVWKSANQYSDGRLNEFDWMNEIDTNRIIIGHLRSASFGTNKTQLENHPFVFDDKNDKNQKCHKFIAMHNGKFDGVHIPKWCGEPVSDSYQAFKKLTQSPAIHSASISKWLSEFEVGSTFAFMILQNNCLYLARDEKCKLYYAPLGNGIITMTSAEILEQVRSYAAIRHKIRIGPIEYVPCGRLYRLEYGNMKFSMRQLTYSFKVVPFTSWYNSTNQVKPAVPANTVTSFDSGSE